MLSFNYTCIVLRFFCLFVLHLLKKKKKAMYKRKKKAKTPTCVTACVLSWRGSWWSLDQAKQKESQYSLWKMCCFWHLEFKWLPSFLIKYPPYVVEQALNHVISDFTITLINSVKELRKYWIANNRKERSLTFT